MQLLAQWRGVSSYLLRDAGTFFDRYEEEHGVGYPMAYLALSVLVVMLPALVLAAILNRASPTAVASAALGVVVLAGLLWLWTLIEAAIAHVLLSLAGADGYATTLEAYAFPSVVRYSLWWLPVLNVVAGFVGLYLQVRGLADFHDVSDAWAATVAILAALTPLLVFFVLGLVATFVFGYQAPTDPTGPTGVPASALADALPF